jgi:hypothetical protein
MITVRIPGVRTEEEWRTVAISDNIEILSNVSWEQEEGRRQFLRLWQYLLKGCLFDFYSITSSSGKVIITAINPNWFDFVIETVPDKHMVDFFEDQREAANRCLD